MKETDRHIIDPLVEKRAEILANSPKIFEIIMMNKNQIAFLGPKGGWEIVDLTKFICRLGEIYEEDKSTIDYFSDLFGEEPERRCKDSFIEEELRRIICLQYYKRCGYVYPNDIDDC